MPGESRALVVHGGGPTAVLNASLAGIIEAWTNVPGKGALFGARFGVDGLVAGDWVELSDADAAAVRALRTAPGSAIGSSRVKLGDAAAARLLAELRLKRVDCLFYTGGNGSMGTASMLAQLAEREHPELRVIGVPKTVDNDLMVTDHSPGFGSAARFYALATRDIGDDNRALRSPVTVVEAIGRNAGWVAGATALARQGPDDAPHLIYLPERPPTIEDDLPRCGAAESTGWVVPSSSPARACATRTAIPSALRSTGPGSPSTSWHETSATCSRRESPP